jgi:peptidoglycan L-alanyl-D-glutamate endopeptidase CwlK
MNSRHITGHAVDVVPYPIAHRLSYPDYQWENVADALLDAAIDLKVDLEWGYAKWGWDKPHYQLSWRSYK